MNPTFLIAAISAAIAGAVGFGLAWRLQTANILEMENATKDTRILAAQVARKAIERATSQVSIAQSHAALRTRVLRADADASRDALDGLRTSSASALRAAASSLDSCIATATTFSVVSNQCSERYTTLARDAQGHVSDVQTMTEGWPK